MVLFFVKGPISYDHVARFLIFPLELQRSSIAQLIKLKNIPKNSTFIPLFTTSY